MLHNSFMNSGTIDSNRLIRFYTFIVYNYTSNSFNVYNNHAFSMFTVYINY